MSTNLSRFFEQARLARGLKPGQLAQLIGKNVSKIGNSIRTFELTGDISKELFGKLVAFFEIDAETIERLVEQDRREFFEKWLAWVNDPITPHLVVRIIAAIYTSKAVPPEITTMEKAETWAAAVAKESRRKCCLVWSRRISIWFDERGDLVGRSEAMPGEPNVPWMRIGGKTFNFGEELRSVNVVDWPRKPGA